MKKKQIKGKELPFKSLKKMILSLFMFLVLFSPFSSQGEGISQKALISIDMKNVSLEDIFLEIRQKTGIRLFYSLDKIKDIKNLTVNSNNQPLNELLETILQNTDLTYSYMDDVVVIKDKTPQNEVRSITISGIVKDKNGNSLPGVTVVIENTSTGVATDVKGEFKITAPVNSRLVFSFIGMKTLVKEIVDEKYLQVVLEEETSEIDEVVVTGIFQKSRESYTGAVTTITAEELAMFGNRNLLTTIRNIDPSFNILRDNNYGSDPNRLPEIQIRGSSSVPTIDVLRDTTVFSSNYNINQPLFIQDGFEITLEQMMDLNDDEVELVNLLKDASATALYGSRGANGVVVIKTKDPIPGKLKVIYRGYLNIEIPDLSDYDVLNAREKLELEVIAGLYRSKTALSEQQLRQVYHSKLREVERGVDTYWLSKPLQTGVGQRHDLRLEGGAEAFRYSASLSYNDVVGVMKKSGRKTFNGGLKLIYKHKNVTFTNNLTIGLNKAENSPYGKFSDYVKLNPYWTPYDEEGKIKLYLEYETYSAYNRQITNPLYNATLHTFNTSEYTRITNNFAIEFKVLEDISVRGRVGVSKTLNNSDIYKPRKHTDFADYLDDDFLRKGEYTYGTGKNVSYDGDLTVNYSKQFKDRHQIYFGLNFNASQVEYHNYIFKFEGFSNEKLDFPSIALQYAKDGKPTGSEDKSRRVGFVGNINYMYANTYFLDLLFRTDGSSQFGANQKFAPFWSSGIGWNVHNESFFDLSFVDLLRLKASYGVSGSQNFKAYQALKTYQYNVDDRYQAWNGAYLMAIGNPDLKWQQTYSWNFGIEAKLFQNRWGFEFNYYRKTTNNLLSDLEIHLANGFSNYTENFGKVANNGFELSTNVQIINNTEQKLFWTVRGSLVLNKNKILKLSDAIKRASEEIEENEKLSNPKVIYREGKAMNTIYAVKSLGIDPSTGKEIYRDRNGYRTYKWSSDDLADCGIEEKYRGNFSTTIRYKNVSANISFGYRFGAYMYNSTLIDRIENADLLYNVDKRVFTDRWQKPGDKSKFLGITETSPGSNASSRFVQKENTLECQNINLTYDLRNDWLKQKFRVSVLTFQYNMEELFRVSSIKQERGLLYPFSRKMSFTLSASF